MENLNNDSTVRGQGTVLKDIIDHLQIKSFDETFKPRIVLWLPDERPTVIFIRSALDAIFCYYQIKL